MMNRGRRVVRVVAACCAGACLQIAASGQAQGSASASVEAVQVRPNFFMLVGAGANIGAQVGEDGVVLVDSGSERAADAVLAAVKKLSDKPIRYIIDTGADADHVGANSRLSGAGQSLGPAGGMQPGGITVGIGAPIIATENVLLRMSAPTGQQSPYAATAWPTETFTGKQKVLFLNDEGIEVISAPAAHTDADSMVLFRRSDVVVAGDVFDFTRFPVVDVEKGGSIEGEIAALNRLIELAIPSIPMPSKEGGTRVVPGHGRICTQADVVEYRDMVTIVRDRVADLMKSGKTLAQIEASSPTEGWTSRYGAASAQPFVDAIYTSLTPKPVPTPAKTKVPQKAKKP